MRKLLLILLLCITASASGQFFAPNQKPCLGLQINRGHQLGDPIALSLFNEDSGNKVFDLSGNGNTGTIVNSAWAAGKFGSVWEGDGTSDDYINCGNKSVINDIVPITVSAWIYPHDTGEGGTGRIYDKRGAGEPKDGWVLLLGGTNYMYLVVDFSDTDIRAYTVDNAITMNAWNHIVMTWDGSITSANIHFYVNGVETGYQNPTNGIGTRSADAANDLLIGNSGDLDRCFDGLIDVPMIYNRILSASEIAQLYSKPFCMVGPSIPVTQMYDWAEAAPTGGQVITIQMTAIPLILITTICFIMGRKNARFYS